MSSLVNLLSVFTAICMAECVERGFVYCPAYPCSCESKDGALIINCRNLYLSTLPKFLSFDGRIKELSLRQNSIRSLPANGFQGLNVESLDLLGNAVTSIDDHAFDGLKDSLKGLSIQLYALNGLPTSSLSKLYNLERLVIAGCKQPDLDAELFRNLTMLKELHLISCRISHIQPGAFSPLVNLNVLNLAHNALRFRHLHEISTIDALADLDLSHNDIQLLDNLAFSRLSKLKNLKLSCNRILYIAKRAFYNLDYSLEQLDLHANELKEQALESLRYLKSLRRLDLDYNNVSSLSEEYFTGQSHLTWLNIAHNDLYVILRGSFKGLELSLLELNLHGNPLELIESGTFSDFKRLHMLSINTTNLGGTLKYDTFKGLTGSLKILDACKSELSSEDIKAFATLSSLVEINLSQNQIRRIRFDDFKKWFALKSANFSHNDITQFLTGNLSTLNSSLRFLDLSWNKIETIQECALFVFRNLDDVRLEGNPLTCDCRMSWLYRWLQVTDSGLNRIEYPWSCKVPSQFTVKLFSELDFSDFNCPNSSSYEHKCLSLYHTVRPLETSTTLTTYIVQTTEVSKHITFNVSRFGPQSIRVHWHADANTNYGGFTVTLKRSNDSSEISSVTVSPDTDYHTFLSVADNLNLEVCIIPLSERFYPLDEACQLINSSRLKPDSKTRKRALHTLLHNSFLPLLLIYISGSLALAFIFACIVVCIRKKRRKPLRVDPMHPPRHRSSITSLPLNHDPFLLNTIFHNDVASLWSSQGNRSYHDQSTLLADRVGYHEHGSPDTRQLPGTRRVSWSEPGIRRQSYACSTFRSMPPHLATEILAGQPDMGDDFYFYF